MFNVSRARLQQKHRTIRYPDGPAPAMPDRFRGCPVLDPSRCPADCRACSGACPVNAIERLTTGPRIDLGLCLFCGACAEACPTGTLRFTDDHRLAASRREDLRFDGRALTLAQGVQDQSRRIFGRSLKLREVSAGGCNACEADTNVLNTLAYDLGRFGIQFVASPRHADGVLLTGPISRNMSLALRKTLDAVPDPRLVIAVGACAIGGGPFRGHDEVENGAESLPSCDLYVPGCPPHPLTILDGLLRLLERLPA